MEWEQLKAEVEKGFATMQDQIDSLQASLGSKHKPADESAVRRNTDGVH